ncbi:hypothetical protein WJX77_011498 [Trebouxia sp. C0004]
MKIRRDRTFSSCSVSAALHSRVQTFQHRSAVGRAKSRVNAVTSMQHTWRSPRSHNWASTFKAVVILTVLARCANCTADGTALLEFSGNITNFAAVSAQNSFKGWVNGTDPCLGWTGVTCNAQDLVTSLNMSSYGFKGSLADGLNDLTGLVNLSLSNNSFEGSLPSAWGWTPKLQLLQNLYLDQNPNLNATLPPSWGSPGGFSSLQVLNISSSNITGALPLTWGSPGALPALVNLELGHNSITGTLPTYWSASNSLPRLRSLGLTDNLLNGSLPGEWGSQAQAFPSLEVLNVALNNLTGSLPSTWCGQGFPSLTELYVQNNNVSGTLPSTWGATECFASLATLALHNNSLSGSMPISWGSSTSFASLVAMVILPGNPGICGSVPGTLEAAQLTPNGSTVLTATSFGTCPEASNAAAPIPAEAKVNSSDVVLVALVPRDPRHQASPDGIPAPSAATATAPLPNTLSGAFTPLQILRHTSPTPPLTSAPIPTPHLAPSPSPSLTPAPVPTQLPAPPPSPTNSPTPSPALIIPTNSAAASPTSAPSPIPTTLAPAPVPAVEAPVPAPEEEVSAAAPTPTEILLAPLPPTPPSSPGDVNLMVGLNLAGGSSLLPYTNTTKEILVAAFRKSVNDNGQVQLLSVQAPATTATGSPTTVYNVSSSSSARRLLQSASNVTATFGYTTSKAVASTFQSTFNTSQFNQALSVQGATGIQTILQNVDGLEAALAAPATAPAAAPVATPAATTVPVPSPASKKALGGGGIAGIAIGAGAGIALIAGALLWFCCRHHHHQKQPTAKWQLPKEEASSGPFWGAAMLGFLGRPFRQSPPANLVASKAVDLTHALEDPERPSLDSKGLHPAAPQPSVDYFMQQLPADNQSDIPPLVKQDLAGAIAAGAVVVGHNEALQDKSSMAHSDSAVSLPHSNASSVQAPGTPVAPAVANTVRDSGSSNESKSDSGTSASSSARLTNLRGTPKADPGLAYVGPVPGRRPEMQVKMKPASHSAYQASSSRDARPGIPRQGSSPARHKSGSTLATLQRQPSISGMQPQPGVSGTQRHPTSSGLQSQPSSSSVMSRQASLTALLRLGSSPALQRRSEQSPALQKPQRPGGSSPALQRPGTASSSATQRQGSGTGLSGPNGILRQGALAALLRQASSPGMQRPKGTAGGLHHQGPRQGSSPAVQRPEPAASVMQRQGGSSSVLRQSRSPDLQRPESSSAAAGRLQGQGSRARGSSPAQQRQGPLPPPVVAADFARKGSSGLTAYPSGDLGGRSERERLLALSRRARRALERELHASHQQRSSSSGSAPNRSSSVQPAGQGASSRPQEGQGASRDGNRPQDRPRPADRRAGGRSGPQAGQKELSDRAIKILEELTSLGRQGSVPPGQQMSRDQAAGISNGRAGRETPQRLMRQHSELPFHSSGRTNPNPNPSRPDSRLKQTASADPQAASGSASESRGLDKQHRCAQNVSRYGSSTPDARPEQGSSSRQHSRQKSRPSSARP